MAQYVRNEVCQKAIETEALFTKIQMNEIFFQTWGV